MQSIELCVKCAHASLYCTDPLLPRTVVSKTGWAHHLAAVGWSKTLCGMVKV